MLLSHNFLADLQAVAPRRPEQSISAHFLDDLAAVHKTMEETAPQSISRDELGFISKHLEEWRSKAQKELAMLIDKLPEDDPLLCPISLFGTMDYGRLETAHTRTLAWLLNPTKEHGFGSKLLEALLVRVDGQRLPVEVTRVESELFISVASRIDIFAEGVWINENGKRIPWMMALEAKIDAWEGEEQLTRYDAWLDSRVGDREVLRVFLTPDGRQPSMAVQEWFPLKFQELAEAFRLSFDELRDKPGYHYLRFYLAGVLRDVCGWPIPIRTDCIDPYSVLSYIKHAIKRK